MTTKEAILEKRRAIFGNKHMELFSNTILVVMEEYAIAFGEFLETKTIGERQRYTTQELHNKFIEQQNKPS